MSQPSPKSKGREPAPAATPIELCILIMFWIPVASRVFYPSEDASSGSGALFLTLVWPAVLLTGLRFGWRTPGRSRTVCLGWLLFAGWCWVSAAFSKPSVAPSIMALEFSALAGLLLALGPLVERFGTRAFSGVLLSFTIVQSLAAIWQVAVELPEVRRQIERPDGSMARELRAAGLDPKQRLTHDRLLSKEPFGTFALPNSLAGFLLLGIPLVAQGGLALARSRRFFPAIVAGLGLLFLLIALALTKSRSALVVCAIQLAWTFGADVFQRRTSTAASPVSGVRKWLPLAMIGVGGLLLAGVALVRMGQWDALDLKEAPKSLRYRLEYWVGAWGVFSEAPIVGVGQGNFGDYYLRHKLPFSSEEIQDPHNFLMELLASLGVVGALLYGCACATILLGRSKCSGGPAVPHETPAGAGYWTLSGASLVALFLVDAIVGLPGLAARPLLWTSPIVFALVGMLSRGLPDDVIARHSLLRGAVGMHLHWLLAGGIGFPGLAWPCWIAAAISLQTKGGFRSDSSGSPWQARAGLLVGAGLLLVLGWVNAGVVERELFRLRDRNSGISRDRSENARAWTERFPNDPDGWWSLGLAAWRQANASDANPSLGELERVREAWMRCLALAPRRSNVWRSLGDVELLGWRNGFPDFSVEAARHAWTEMLDTYPNSAVRSWEFGVIEILAKAPGSLSPSQRQRWLRFLYEQRGNAGNVEAGGGSREAEDLASETLAQPNFPVAALRRALVLDQTPHPDKRLSPAQRIFAERLTREREN